MCMCRYICVDTSEINTTPSPPTKSYTNDVITITNHISINDISDSDPARRPLATRFSENYGWNYAQSSY